METVNIDQLRVELLGILWANLFFTAILPCRPKIRQGKSVQKPGIRPKSPIDFVIDFKQL